MNQQKCDAQQSSEAEIRKQRSIERLKQHNVPYTNNLPVIESSTEIKIKTPEQIAKRTHCAFFSSLYAECLMDFFAEKDSALELYKQQLRIRKIEKNLSRKEKTTFQNMASKHDLIQVVWRMESVWVLFWALGLVDELTYPDKPCKPELICGLVTRDQSLGEFLGRIRPRTVHEILDEADLIYRYHWACVEADIHDEAMPAYLDRDVVLERHKALNWLIGYDNNWDDTATDT